MKRNTIKNKRYNINMPTNLYYKPTFIPAQVNFTSFAKALIVIANISWRKPSS